MTALTRRRCDNEHQDSWHIYFGDACVGAIGVRAGVPTSADQWGWRVGFYPGMEPGTQRSGSAGTFDEARVAFEGVWRQLEPTLTEDNYEAWRLSRDFHAWKYRMWAEGCRMPTQNQSGWSKCFCGESIPVAYDAHVSSVHRGIGA